MAKVLTPDICVIGDGGFSIAAAAVTLGVPVIVVRDGRNSGGRAGVSALIAAGRQAHALRAGAAFGVKTADPEIDFRALSRHVRAVSDALAVNESAERLTALGVRVIAAEPRFKDRRTLVAGEVEIRARRFVIATGASSLLPAGIEAVDCLTEETVGGLTRRPGHLIVLGAGPAGLELAQAMRRLGSEVTVLEPAQALPGEDREMVALLLAALRAEGVDVHEGAAPSAVERRGKSGLRVQFETKAGRTAVDGTHLLVTSGRAPNVAGLDLARAGVEFGENGIKVSPELRTANSRIYAIGEAVDPQASAALAGQHAGLVTAALLLRRRGKEDRRIVPRLVRTGPELASVGLPEAEAMQAAGKGVRVLRAPYSENGRAAAERRTAGHIKIIADEKGAVISVSILGAEAGEAIGVWSLALQKGLSLEDMAAWVPAHPSFAEIGKGVAMTYLSARARSASARRLVRFLRLLG